MDLAEARYDTQVSQMRTAIQQVRDSFRNQAIPEIPMKLGSPLKECKISGFKDGVLSSIHSSGTARLTPAQLPPDISDRLKVDWNPTLVIPSDGTETPKITSALSENSLELAQLSDHPDNSALIAQKSAALAALQTKTLAAKQQQIEYQRLAGLTSAPIEAGLNIGKLGAKHLTPTEARDAAELLANQIQAAETQINQLQLEIAALRNQ